MRTTRDELQQVTEEAIAAAERIVYGFQWVQDELSKSPSTCRYAASMLMFFELSLASASLA